MKPTLDLPKSSAPEHELSRIVSGVERVRKEFLDCTGLGTGENTIQAVYGLSVLAQFELKPTDLVPPGLPASALGAVYEEIARRFLDHVLPERDELQEMPAAGVVEYLGALDAAWPDPGRLAAAFGACRMSTFAGDKRLVYRVGGYRGRRGNALADYFVETVIFPAAAAMGYSPAI